MFHLSKIKHTLQLHPQLLGLPLIDAIKGELQMQFLDKIIANLGLCISVYDILSMDGGFIYPGDGCSSYEVVIRLVMFQPFIGEILTGKIEESNSDGLRLSLGFYNDIYVPVHQLQQPCKRRDDGIWLWDYNSEDLSLDLNEEVHFQVISVNYPPIPVTQDATSKPFAPMEIVAGMRGDGLGVVSWWQD
ncbi:DNA-directed RNA polymerase III subunit RPC8 [Phalaenopsis equestris]|uniref:DNA-directed RNA polymerase III subunit RPC8 n=1 Tax=Phalaenopsis equestris TaxID=78828 RepID=UPI0009E3FEAC|nr:DNA-directed RNA polymerase III subunit RPC8 [Phalaenopsis equestris]